MSDSEDMSDSGGEHEHLSDIMQLRVNNIAQCKKCDGYLVCDACVDVFHIKLPKQYGQNQGHSWPGDICERFYGEDDQQGCPIGVCSICHMEEMKQCVAPFEKRGHDICAGCMLAVDIYADGYDTNAACKVCGFVESDSECESACESACESEYE
jgi:hypothetical protein